MLLKQLALIAKLKSCDRFQRNSRLLCYLCRCNPHQVLYRLLIHEEFTWMRLSPGAKFDCSFAVYYRIQSLLDVDAIVYRLELDIKENCRNSPVILYN